MNILISGSSGLVGRALSMRLAKAGHQVFPLLRNDSGDLWTWQPDRKKITLDPEVKLDVVINLSGESSQGRWTRDKKAEILNSRVAATGLLASTIVSLKYKPAVFISASAVGYYGDTGQTEADESAENGEDFLAHVAARWEQASFVARDAGIRTVNIRSGVVLSPEGGALKEMLTPFRYGLGGVIGNGSQYWSWVSIEDLVNMIQFIIDNESLRGPVNLVSPGAVTNREFTKSLGKALRRPAIFPMPAVFARLVFGEMADAMLLSSVRVAPGKLTNAGYRFIHPDLESAFQDLV